MTGAEVLHTIPASYARARLWRFRGYTVSMLLGV